MKNWETYNEYQKIKCSWTELVGEGGNHGGNDLMREWKKLHSFHTKVDIYRWTMKNEFSLSHASHFIRDWNIPT